MSRAASVDPSQGSENEDDQLSLGAQPAKRRRVVNQRRALSCTECKRRKTRCTSGVVPCEACIKRGKPDQCKWENGPGEVAAVSKAPDTYALASDLQQLKSQLVELATYVFSLPGGPANASASAALGSLANILSSSAGESATPSTSLASLLNPTSHQLNKIITPTSQPLPTPSSSSGGGGPNMESAVTSLEHLANSGHNNNNATTSSQPTASPFPSSSLSHNSPSLPILPPVHPAKSLPPLLDLNARPQAIMDMIFSLIPDATAGKRLAALYFQCEYHLGWHILHGPTFGKELREFYDLDPATRRAQTDPAWIAVFLMVLVFGLQSASPIEACALFPHLDRSEVPRLPSALYQASRMALEVARADSVPQVRAIISGLLYFPFLYHFGFSAEEGTRAITHLNCAIYCALSLSLHRVTSPSKVPMSDPAFSSLSPPLAFELVKRLWHHLSFLDGTTGSSLTGFRLCALPGLMKKRVGNYITIADHFTPFPGNYTDEDIMMDPLPKEREVVEVTAATVARVGSMFAFVTRKFVGSVAGRRDAGEKRLFSDETRDDDFLDDEVKEYHGALQQVLDYLPSPLLDPTDVPNWMICCLYSSIQNRILRMYRPIFARETSGPAYERAREASLASARCIISKQRLCMACPHLRPGFVKRWILGSALVLSVDLIKAIDNFEQVTVLNAKRTEIQQALEIFEQHNPFDRSPAVTQQCAKTIEAVLIACQKRLEMRLDGKPLGESEALRGFFETVGNGLREPVGKSSVALLFYNSIDIDQR
ncbi:hypothetical protein T439DRAFT_48962 [Meredithblackwellia eburnea MCA 4105]